MFAANSFVFVPGSRPDRFARAHASGAGLTVIDLEDAVPADEKAAARANALAQVASGQTGWAIRINGVATAAGIADLAALIEAECLPPFLFIPMVESAVEVEIVARALGDRCPELIPLIETPKGLRQAVAIACAPMVGGVMFGGVAEHDAIATAITNRDPAAAYEAMRAHLRSVSQRLFGEN